MEPDEPGSKTEVRIQGNVKMQELTERQQAVLDWIRKYMGKHGGAPTRAEIAEGLGLYDASSVKGHVEALQRKGWLEVRKDQYRGIRLLEPDLPVIGPLAEIAAGTPILAEEHIVQRLPVLVAERFRPRPDYLLTVRGDSMNRTGVRDRDVVAIRKTNTAKSGQVVVARFGDEVTLKRFVQIDERHVELRPESYKPSARGHEAGPGETHPPHRRGRRRGADRGPARRAGRLGARRPTGATEANEDQREAVRKMSSVPGSEGSWLDGSKIRSSSSGFMKTLGTGPWTTWASILSSPDAGIDPKGPSESCRGSASPRGRRNRPLKPTESPPPPWRPERAGIDPYAQITQITSEHGVYWSFRVQMYADPSRNDPRGAGSAGSTAGSTGRRKVNARPYVQEKEGKGPQPGLEDRWALRGLALTVASGTIAEPSNDRCKDRS